MIDASSRSDWIPLLHNICLTHFSLASRQLFGARGWRSPTTFGTALLQDTLDFAWMQYADPAASQRISAIR
jgi:hypothetical protein